MFPTHAARLALRVLLTVLVLLPVTLFPLLGIIGDRSPAIEHVRHILALLAQHPGWIIVGFAARLLLLLPVSVLLLITGALFGLWWGQIIAVIGLIVSGSLEFLLMRRGIFPSVAIQHPTTAGLGERWQRRLADHPFESVLVLRVILTPFDLVNFACAWSRMRVQPFIAATALGVIPAAFPLVAAGAALPLRQWLSGNIIQGTTGAIDFRYLGLATATLSLSLLLGWMIKRRRPMISAV